jgi:Mor family transcriptional regulator
MNEKTERNENLVKDKLAGMSYSQLSQKYRITRDRVYQIYRLYKLKNNK